MVWGTISVECPRSRRDPNNRFASRKKFESFSSASLDTDSRAYLRKGIKLEVAEGMANYEPRGTTARYDRRNDQMSLDEVENIIL